jgi:hypothetical protein
MESMTDYARERRECKGERLREHDQSRDRWRNVVSKRVVLRRPVNVRERETTPRGKDRNNTWLSEDAGQIVRRRE